jgi:dynein heavy chain, axonemal
MGHAGDTQGIDAVIQRVHAMVEPIEHINFNIFDQANGIMWRAAKSAFYSDNEGIKQSTRELIDTSFRKLRSAEGAFELLQNFKSIQSKGAIQKQMMNKLNDILEQFFREIEHTEEIFETHRATPPVTRNQPPVAGAIKWSRSLFARVKQTMAKLMTMEEVMMAEEIGQQVHAKYLALARSVMYFEKHWFSGWRDSINSIAMQHLKQPVFKKDASTGNVMVFL